jgi:hypothetical protein
VGRCLGKRLEGLWLRLLSRWNELAEVVDLYVLYNVTKKATES